MSHPEPTEAELKTYYEAALEVAKAAGELISTAFKQPSSRVHFKQATDLVTDTDRACEEVVLSTLRQKFPTHLFVGEEVRRGHKEAHSLVFDVRFIGRPVSVHQPCF